MSAPGVGAAVKCGFDSRCRSDKSWIFTQSIVLETCVNPVSSGFFRSFRPLAQTNEALLAIETIATLLVYARRSVRGQVCVEGAYATAAWLERCFQGVRGL